MTLANFAQPSQTISSQDSLVAEELLSFFLKEAKNKKETVMAGLKVQMDLLRGDLLKVESRQQMRSSLLHSSQMLDHLVIRDPTQEVVIIFVYTYIYVLSHV